MDITVGLIKKAEQPRIDAELWCLEKTPRVLDHEEDQIKWSQRKLVRNIHWISDVEAELHTLATWCEGLTHWKTLMMWKIEGTRRDDENETIGMVFIRPDGWAWASSEVWNDG